ncbi:cysteine rich repeat-containing protein [Rhizobium halophytocola]|uniref:Cysteine rich repeat-containing protein n=1 Tax=Rhizobium halophytocola TaxID=735519 RepID=A0ABS4DUW9_9HYPH|nr:cysteine rich repeat-containing protein [Rhizobium halophytocola]MBP1849472.1 hypothetical protein [Rhizobium halophytocola]
MTRYLTVLFVLVSTAASAAQLSLSDKLELRNNCGADIKALCAGIAPGEGRVMACVKEKKAELSKPCADSMAKMAAKLKG